MLEQIKFPSGLKELPVEKLPDLAEEIRQKIIEVVFKNGGHLGSNLGVIELTMALHYVFNFPQDQLIWDVSHQCYTHKILSGRLEQFDTLRLLGGISGFTNPQESPYDIFAVGHAGTSVSTAVGLACANYFLKTPHKAIAVLGDGALTAGITYEALNNAGSIKLGRGEERPNLLVVLNDNKMSISRTIGSMANYLNKLRMTYLYEDIKTEVYKFLEGLPKVGSKMERVLDHIRAAATSVLGGAIFEELGFSYYGPLDGHNIPKLIQMLREIQRFRKPVILHIVTEKGKGCPEASGDPSHLHGIGPVKFADDGKISLSSTGETYTDVFARTVTDLAAQDKKIIAITAAMPEGTGLVEFEKVHPDRYFDVGICEQHAVGFAAGLAKNGLKPVTAIYSTFLQRALDQLFQEVALQRSPIVFALDRAGIVGSDGPTHHGVFDIAYTRCFPEFVLMAPKDGPELSRMIAFALTLKQPVFIRYPRTKIPRPLIFPEVPLELGQPEILREGKDGAMLAYGALVYPAYEAAEELVKEGINLMVVNARFTKPLDRGLIKQLVKDQPFIITAEEHSLTGGFGSAVLELIDGSCQRVVRLGIPDKFIEHGARDKLLANLGLDKAGIIRTVKSLVKQ